MSQQSRRTASKKVIAPTQSVSTWQTEAFLRFATSLFLVLAIYGLASVFGI